LNEFEYAKVGMDFSLEGDTSEKCSIIHKEQEFTFEGWNLGRKGY
jgi:hypothetical protein